MKLTPLRDFSIPVYDLYDRGMPRGDLTGWRDLDPILSIAPAEFTVVTGVPNHGKSAFMDSLMIRLLTSRSVAKPWRFLTVSPEQEPAQLHVAEMLERVIGKRFREGGNRMSKEEIATAFSSKFGSAIQFGTLEEHDSFSILLEEAREFALRNGPDIQCGIVFDPWNRLEHRRPTGMSETDYISEALSLVTSLTRTTGAHFFIVAHPAKLQPSRDGVRPIPTAYDIAGSAGWYNKADNIVCVWRDTTPGDNNTPSRINRIYVQKVRWKHIGRIGMAELEFDPATGRFNDAPGYSTRGGNNLAD